MRAAAGDSDTHEFVPGPNVGIDHIRAETLDLRDQVHGQRLTDETFEMTQGNRLASGNLDRRTMSHGLWGAFGAGRDVRRRDDSYLVAQFNQLSGDVIDRFLDSTDGVEVFDDEQDSHQKGRGSTSRFADVRAA